MKAEASYVLFVRGPKSDWIAILIFLHVSKVLAPSRVSDDVRPTVYACDFMRFFFFFNNMISEIVDTYYVGGLCHQL